MMTAIALTLVFVAGTSALGARSNLSRVRSSPTVTAYLGVAIGIAMAIWCVIAAYWLMRS